MAATLKPRFLHLDSEIVWAEIEALPLSLQHEVMRELATRFASDGCDSKTKRGKVAEGVAGLHEAAAFLQRSPSSKSYDKLREEEPGLGLPASTNIRRWLGEASLGGGGWNECLRIALLDAVSDIDFVSEFVGRTYRFSDSELFDALRECVDDLGRVPMKNEFLEWAKRPDVAARPGRRPRSDRPFARFGGFRKALCRAGVITESEARHAVTGRVLRVRDVDAERKLHAAREERVMVWVRRAWAKKGEPFTGKSYADWRQEMIAAGESGIPSLSCVEQTFGGWKAARRRSLPDDFDTPRDRAQWG